MPEPDSPPPPAPAIGSRLSLRILATTDLHMNLGAGPGGGLARLAPLIAAERAAGASVLLDNGDLIEGNAHADELGRIGLRKGEVHPAIAALNRLGYDAATLGNHDFAHGLGFLHRALRDARFAVTLANAVPRGPEIWTRTLLLDRQLQDESGAAHRIAIGIFGVLPPQTTQWEAGLAAELSCTPILPAARHAIAALRAQGADVIVALSHGGLGCLPRDDNSDATAATAAGRGAMAGHRTRPDTMPGPQPVAVPCPPACEAIFSDEIPAAWPAAPSAAATAIVPDPADENVAAAIAALPGVDAVIAGHTHEVVIRPATPGRAVIVQPGHGGSHLAAITLQMERGADRWQVRCTSAAALPAAARPCPAALRHAAIPAALARRLVRPVGHSPVALSSHYALIGADSALRLTEAALRAHVARAMPDCPLPVLVALNPFRTGGRGGADNFVHLPAGQVRRRDLIALYPHTNHIAAIAVTGTEIRAWLERAARLFHRISPDMAACGPQDPALPPAITGTGKRHAPAPPSLIDPAVPGYMFDVIAGVDYTIDLSRPALSDAGLCDAAGAQGRIRDLRLDERPIVGDDRFVLITNSYRLGAGSAYAALIAARNCLLPAAARRRIRDILGDAIASPQAPQPEARPFFRLVAPRGSLARFETAPAADPATCPLPATPAGISDTGLLRLDLRF
ncbi:MAG: 5'-nucleotidase C-terminal domain-containing protein [Paracoccus sp. (in: a-proteobacteria)]|nr:5'-nucleotidase C-terminal domain-containing protein [Paracoccus sp. (in: a-proteobacteria)]